MIDEVTIKDSSDGLGVNDQLGVRAIICSHHLGVPRGVNVSAELNVILSLCYCYVLVMRVPPV